MFLLQAQSRTILLLLLLLLVVRGASAAADEEEEISRGLILFILIPKSTRIIIIIMECYYQGESSLLLWAAAPCSYVFASHLPSPICPINGNAIRIPLVKHFCTCAMHTLLLLLEHINNNVRNADEPSHPDRVLPACSGTRAPYINTEGY